MNYRQLVKKIYEKVSSLPNNQKLNVFLCGGANSKDNKKLRDDVRDEIEKKYLNIRILYPEDLFLALASRNKKLNFLDLENKLADNCDLIFLICESPGSYVELGAFSNHPELSKKLYIAVDKQYKNEKSFIITGPVKYIKDLNEEQVLFYKDKSDIFKKIKTFNTQNKLVLESQEKINSLSKSKYSIETIIGLSDFILTLLYFIDYCSIDELEENLKSLFQNNKNDFEIIYFAALKLNYKEKLIKKTFINSKEVYTLTPQGIIEFKEKRSINSRICDRIRLDVLYSTFNFK